METYQPDLFLGHNMDDLPVSSLGIKLLNRSPVCEGLITNCINEALGEGATVWTSYSLRQLRKGLLPFRIDIKTLTLLEVIAFQGPTYDEDLIVFLSYAEIYSIVHHLTKSFKLPLWDVKLNDLRAWHIRTPIEAL